MQEFDLKIIEHQQERLRSKRIDTLQVNLGRLCNLQCVHCYLECSPIRAEVMPIHVLEKVIQVVRENKFQLVDITGGSPEYHREFRRALESMRPHVATIQVRSNLVCLIDKHLRGLAEFLKEHKIRIVGSLPSCVEGDVDAQRGEGSFIQATQALQMLNHLGYGHDPDLQLHLVYNPGGAYLPDDLGRLEEIYRMELQSRFNIQFNRLIGVTNMPIGRFKKQLEDGESLDSYTSLLRDSFSTVTLDGLMCRHQVCVDWDGRLYDCDFNIALNRPLEGDKMPKTIFDFDMTVLRIRQIRTGAHCFGCTAGAGAASCTESGI